jgi:hypothetical protein
MLETYFSAPKMLEHLRSGPSGPYIDGFAALLRRDGYSSGTAVRYLRAAAHLGHFVHEQGRTLADIDLSAFGGHLQTCRCPRSAGGRRNHHTLFGAKHFRDFLLKIGVCQSDNATPETQPAEPELAASFKQWLRKHRGAADPTIRLYARGAASLMMALGDDPSLWDAKGVREYFMERSDQMRGGSVEKLITSMRAFMRYLAVEGKCQADLDKAVPAYASWRLAELPRYLTAEQVDSLIAVCDGASPGRRRDRAILCCWRVSDFGLATWRSFASPISSGRLARCASAGSRAIKFGYRSRKKSGTRSSPTSNAGLPPVKAIMFSFETSPLIGHS